MRPWRAVNHIVSIGEAARHKTTLDATPLSPSHLIGCINQLELVCCSAQPDLQDSNTAFIESDYFDTSELHVLVDDRGVSLVAA